MKDAANRLWKNASARLGSVLSRYGPSVVTIFIVAIGLFAVLGVQPPPATFAEGWSTPREIKEVYSREPHRAVIDSQDRIHLVWLKTIERKQVAFYAQLDRHGQILGEPVRLSPLQANAENVHIVLIQDDVPLAFWIEKGVAGAAQHLVMARPVAGQVPQILSTLSGIMRDLVVTIAPENAQGEQGQVFAAWSDNREGVYEIYLTVLDDRGSPWLSDHRLTDTGNAFVFEPTLAVGDSVVHLTYFSDMITTQELVHQVYDLGGEPVAGPLVLQSETQAVSGLAGTSAQTSSYPVLSVAQADDLSIYELLGTEVRLRRIDRDGRTVQSPKPFLTGTYYSQLSFVRGQGERWLVWGDTRGSRGERLQIYAAPFEEMDRVGEETRLTFVASSTLWPLMMLDSAGGQHLLWQQSARASTYRLNYANNLDAASVSFLQQLGFVGEKGNWSFWLALIESAFLAVFTSAVRVWRLAIALVATALVYYTTVRIEIAKQYLNIICWTALLVALGIIIRPELETLGQLPIVVIIAAHWVMMFTASAATLYLGWVWRQSFHNVFIWAGMGGLWIWVYYFLNIVLILREGFVV